jgi:dihydrofolate reductase
MKPRRCQEGARLMRKIIESTFVTLDGVIQDPQNWSPPYWDDEHLNYNQNLMRTADTMLLGRVTWEGFAQAWPPRAGKGDAFADKFNEMPKYVASRTLRAASWNTTVLKGDAATEVQKLKQQDGGDIIKYGTGEFSRALLAHKLVDEFHFWMFPVVVGSGTRLFDGIDAMTHLKLVDTTTFASGIVILVYAPK